MPEGLRIRERHEDAYAWALAQAASFADHGEPAPVLPAGCPFSLDELIDPDLDIERLVAKLRSAE